ncbi:MAG: sensor histidine kinase [Armatimonadota bacterium]
MDVSFDKAEAFGLLEASPDLLRWLEALCAVSTDGLLALDETGRILFANARAEQLLGLPRQALLRRDIRELAMVLHGASPEEPHPLLRSLDTGRTVPPTGLTLLHPDGARRCIQLQSIPLSGDHGRTLGAAISLREGGEEGCASPLRQAEAHAAELDATISAIADGVVIYNTAMEIIRLNTAAESLLELTPDARKLPFHDRIIRSRMRSADGHPLTPDELPSLRALRGETLCGEIASITHTDGRELWLAISAAPIHDPQGVITGVVSTFTDITVMRELQQRQDDLLHIVSHDLFIPLTVIHGHMQLIKETLRRAGIEESLADSLDAIARAEQRMHAMARDLVDTAGLEGGQLRLELQPVKLAPYVGNMLRRLRGALDTRRVTVEIPEALPPVSADTNRLERILVNLLSNALKYSPEGSTVGIQASAAECGVDISVVDRGRGIGAEDLPLIFERFYRAQSERKAEGIGLGLYITKGLVEAHGGRIHVVSAPGQGSTFTFSMPKAVT